MPNVITGRVRQAFLAGMHIKLHMQVNHDESLISFTFHGSVIPMTLTFSEQHFFSG